MNSRSHELSKAPLPKQSDLAESAPKLLAAAAAWALWLRRQGIPSP